MRIFLKLVLDCEPDAAWRALRSPAMLQQILSPLVTLKPLEPDRFPTIWSEGEHRVAVCALGIIPLGRQVIDIHFSHTAHSGVRILHDRGQAHSGLMAVNSLWDHRMAISAAPAASGKTLYRDRLVIKAGILTPAIWLGLWVFWQFRAHGLKRLAPTWADDEKC